MAPVVFNSSQVFREAEVLKTTISAKRKDDFSVGGELWSSCQSLQDLYKSLLLSDLSYALEKKVEQELFRLKHSTLSALIQMCDEWLENMDDGKLNGVVFFDIQKAFDSINHKILLTKMNNYFGISGLELRWNSAFKIHIDNMRQQAKDKKSNKKTDLQALLMLFLETASGFYIQLLNELCMKYTLEVPGYINPASLGIIHDVNSNKKIVKKPSSSACYYICQDCLVHLGDLARYRNEIIEAELYYKQALQLVPTNGQPYNQLAILASSKGDTLGTVYFYCRSIAVKNPFPAASTNLTKTLSKVCQTASSSQPAGKISKADFIQLFIQFHGCIYLGQDLNVANSLTEKAASALKGLLETDDLSASDLVKLVTINLFLLHHIHSNGYDDGDDFDSLGKDDPNESWNITLEFTMKLLENFLSRIVQYEPEVNNANPPLFVNNIFPALQVVCQWLKANISNICKDNVVINQPRLWIDFVDLLNAFFLENGLEKSDIALPEDQELQGFSPLQGVHRKLDFSSNRNSKKEELQERKSRLLQFGLCLSRHITGVVSCRKMENGYHRFLHNSTNLDEAGEKLLDVLPALNLAIDTNGSRGTNTPFVETSSLFGNTNITHQIQTEPISPVHNSVGQYSLFQSAWNVPLTVGNTVPGFVSSSSSPTSSSHPSIPSTIVNSVQDSAPLVTSLAVGSHRNPTFANPAQSLPVPPTSLAVGSNRPLSPGNRVTPSPNGEKKQFPTPSSFGINIGTGVWSPLANAAGNVHPEPAGGGKPQTNGNGSSIWGSGFQSAQSSMSPLEQLLKEQKSQQNS